MSKRVNDHIFMGLETIVMIIICESMIIYVGFDTAFWLYNRIIIDNNRLLLNFAFISNTLKDKIIKIHCIFLFKTHCR